MAITDLTNVWIEKPDPSDLRYRHDKLNKSIDIQQEADILGKKIFLLIIFLGLLQDFLEKGEGGPQLIFENIDEKLIILKVKIELKASCFFNWEFNLEKIDIQKAKEIMTGDLISNMLETVKALDRRSEYFYEKFEEIEALYINKLAGVERSSYKSEINDNEEFWYKLLTKTNKNEKISDFNLSKPAQFFMNKYSNLNFNTIQSRSKRKSRRSSVSKEKDVEKNKSAKKSKSKTNLSKLPSKKKLEERDIEEENKRIQTEKLKKEKKTKLNFL